MKKVIVWAIAALVFFSLLTFMVQREINQIKIVDNLIRTLQKEHHSFVAYDVAKLVNENFSKSVGYWTKNKIGNDIVSLAETGVYLFQFDSNGNLIYTWDKYGDFGVAWSGLDKGETMRLASEDEEMSIFKRDIPMVYNSLVANTWDILLNYFWQIVLVLSISLLPVLFLLKFTVVIILLICFVSALIVKNVDGIDKLKINTFISLVKADSSPDNKAGPINDLVDDYFEMIDFIFIIIKIIIQLLYLFSFGKIKSYHRKIEHIPNFVSFLNFLIKTNSKLKLAKYGKECSWLFRPATEQFTRIVDGDSWGLSSSLRLLSGV